MVHLRSRHWLFCGILALASACATATPYQPAGSGSEYGFSEQKIEDDRWRISFRGNALTERELVETFLLYRAAQVTVEQGFDHFIVVRDDTEKQTTYSGTRPAFYGFGRPFPYYGWGYRFDPFYDDFDVRERNRYRAIAYIVLGSGPKPENQPTAYDARQVLENLRPVVEQPVS